MTGRGLVSVVFKQTEGGSRPFLPRQFVVAIIRCYESYDQDNIVL